MSKKTINVYDTITGQIVEVEVIIILQCYIAWRCLVDTKIGNVISYRWEPCFIVIYISSVRVSAVAEKRFAQRAIPRHYVYTVIERIGVHINALFSFVIFICELNVEISHVIRSGVDIGE